MKDTVSISRLRYLYENEGLSVPEIADQIGITRQAVYERFRKEKVRLRKRTGRPERIIIPKADLIRLFQMERVLVTDIAKRYRCNISNVYYWLRKYGIPRDHRSRRPSRCAFVDGLSIGETITIETPSGKHPTSILKRAKRIGIRVVIRRIDEHTFSVMRTPLLTRETVRELLESGMNRTEIAEVFSTSRSTIARSALGSVT